MKSRYEDSSSSSSMSTTEEGAEEMQQMDMQMDVQPGDAIDSEGTGAH